MLGLWLTLSHTLNIGSYNPTVRMLHVLYPEFLKVAAL